MNNVETKEKSPSEMHKDHRTRRKTSYLSNGFASFSDVEKLEFILFYAIAQKDTNPIAHRLLDTFGSFKNVIDAPVHALAKVKGMGIHSAILLNLFAETFNAYAITRNPKYITNAEDAKLFVSNYLYAKPYEVFLIICLSNKGKVLLTKTLTNEACDRVIADIKNITEAAINVHSSKIIIAHNHPNGDSLPSDEDIAYTSYALMSLVTNDIDLIDHVITSDEGASSMCQIGVLDSIIESTKVKLRGNPKALMRLTQKQASYLAQ